MIREIVFKKNVVDSCAFCERDYRDFTFTCFMFFINGQSLRALLCPECFKTEVNIKLEERYISGENCFVCDSKVQGSAHIELLNLSTMKLAFFHFNCFQISSTLSYTVEKL
jgi:hypothetical protein